jgi:uncharacterized protein (TIGR02246 family)
MKNFLILTVLLCTTIFNNLQAQTESDEAEIQEFAKKFVTAYNQQDADAIQKMYMDDAVRVDTDGQEMKGADQIAAFFKDQFIKNNVTLDVKQLSLNWSDAQHAFVASGTYEVKGAQIVYDIKIHDTGTYANTMIKENGKWKIARTVLTSTND